MSERQVKDSQGRIYTVTYDDKTGEQTGITQTGEVTQRPIGDTIGGIRATTPADTFRDVWAPPIRAGLVTGGRVLGGAIAAPTANPWTIGAGAVGGGMAGDQIYQLLQGAFPKYFGVRDTNGLLDSVTESAGNTALDLGFEKLSNPISNVASKSFTRSGREELKNKFLQNFFKVNPTVPVQEALRAAPSFNVDTAQATQNPKAKVIRDVLFRQDALNEFARQQPQLTNEANAFLTDVAGSPTNIQTSARTMAGRGATVAEAEFAALRAEERAAYTKAEDVEIPKIKAQAVLTQNIPNVGPISRPVSIEGPVYVNKSFNHASTIIADIDKVLADPTNMMTTDPAAVDSLKSLRDKMSVFVNVPKDAANGQPVISYESAKANKQVLSDFLKNAPDSVRQRYVKSVEAIRNLISTDIRDTANSVWPTEAKDALFSAYNKTKARDSRFLNSIGKNLLSDDPDVLHETAINEALSKVEYAKQWKASVGSRDELGAEYARRILEGSQDNRGYFNGASALEKYYGSFDIAKEALSSEQRKSFEYLMRRMQAVNPNLSETGHVAFAIRHGGAILGIGVGLLRGGINLLQTGDVSESLEKGATSGAVSGLAFQGTVSLTSPILKKLLFDPKNARIAAQLVSAPPQSSQAQLLLRALFRTALKGAQIETQYGPFIVAPDGKLDPVKTEQTQMAGR